jgi:hypothetical protein
MIRAPHEGPHFRHPRQMSGVKAADGTAPNDANTLHLNFPDIAAMHGARKSYRAAR